MIDLYFLEKLTKGDKNKMARYINLYLNIAPNIFENMKRNLEDSDWEQLRINAHSLKPQADYMGIPSLKSALMEIEQNVQNKNLQSLHENYNKAFRIHIASMPYLKAFVLAVT